MAHLLCSAGPRATTRLPALRGCIGVAIACGLIAAAGCSDPLVFADWTIEVPEGTEVIGYAAVPIGERTERIELVEDLVIGGDPDDPQTSFYRANSIAADDAGDIYVLDAGNHRVQVFDERGGYLRTLGSAGQGPGELSQAYYVTIAGDRVAVPDSGTARINYWSLEGEALGAARLAEPSLEAQGLADGSMVGAYPVYYREPEFRMERAFAHVSEEGEELDRYVVLPVPPEVTSSIPYSYPMFASSPDGRVYITRADQYQVLAVEASGEPLWALRTTWPTPPIDQEIFDKTVEMIRERRPDYRPDPRWPTHMYAIGDLLVDGRGNLYVFPYVHVMRVASTGEPLGDPPETLPVDVYAPDGALLFAGLIPAGPECLSPAGCWTAAHGEYVYRMQLDPRSGEQVLVRFRLVTPF